MPTIKKIGVLTGGGDAPGLNAVIRAVVKTATNAGVAVIGLEDSFDGLIYPDKVRVLTPKDVRGILRLGGTILGTVNRGNPFAEPIVTPHGTFNYGDRVMEVFQQMELDALICIGGDGTLAIAYEFYKKGIPLVGVPKTIDNDIYGTTSCFGFDTAVSFATDAIDRLHTTAEAHHRVMVAEVMGRYAGWIALNAGVAGSADVILIPEIPFDLDIVCQKVEERYHRKRNFAIVVAAEGAKPAGGKMFTREHHDAARQEVLLGGVAQYVADEIARRTRRETRSLVLGHLQRGGQPTTFDRLLGTRFGAAAIRLIAEGGFGRMVCLRPPSIDSVPLAEVAIGKPRLVPLESDTILSARALGISFGDRPN
jgi:ATP-dependent phosphofructokinase / diphosphate-dependent phosphofructokinase